jgi:transcriptional regulator with XRE-family HTH domain
MVATRETRRDRGRRGGEELVRRALSELRTARQTAGVSQRQLGAYIGRAQSEVSRLEAGDYLDVPVTTLSEMASVLGMELHLSLHPSGDPIADKAQQPLIGRFLSVVAAPPYRVFREALMPRPGDRRAWDVLLRLDSLLVGVEAETRVRDVQALTRRMRERERDGGVDHVLLVLSDTAHNRRLAAQVREALGERFATLTGSVLAALRSGRPVPGSAVLLM